MCVPKFREFMERNERVKEWLKRASLNTQMTSANNLLRFCEYAHITPDEFQNLEPKKARDIAWDFIETLMEKPSVAVKSHNTTLNLNN